MSFGKRQLLAGTAFAAAVAVAQASGDPARSIQLLPIGDINARDGRKWRVRDAAHAKAIVDASVATAGGTDLPIDYDHQLVFAAKDGVGGNAPAAGWMRNLRVEADGIWADVDWTDAATAKLKAKEYRYISPYFGFDKKSGDVTRVFHAGLVNFPAITELAAVASADADGDPMDLSKLAALFGLAATATIDEIVTAASAHKTATAAQLQTLATAAGAKPDASVEEVATAITEAKASGTVDPTKFVPISEFTAATTRLKRLEDAGAEDKATAAVDGAIAAGKVTPANRDWALGYAKADLAGFEAFLGNAPVVVDAAARTAAARVDPESVAITNEEKALCSAMGLKPEDFLKVKKEELSHGA